MRVEEPPVEFFGRNTPPRVPAIAFEMFVVGAFLHLCVVFGQHLSDLKRDLLLAEQ